MKVLLSLVWMDASSSIAIEDQSRRSPKRSAFRSRHDLRFCPFYSSCSAKSGSTRLDLRAGR